MQNAAKRGVSKTKYVLVSQHGAKSFGCHAKGQTKGKTLFYFMGLCSSFNILSLYGYDDTKTRQGRRGVSLHSLKHSQALSLMSFSLSLSLSLSLSVSLRKF